MSTGVHDEVEAIKGSAATITTYVGWLESEVRSLRAQLESIEKDRAVGDMRGRGGLHTGLTSKLRLMLERKPMTLGQIREQLAKDAFPYNPKSLRVILATTFRYAGGETAGRSGGGLWTLRQSQTGESTS